MSNFIDTGRIASEIKIETLPNEQQTQKATFRLAIDRDRPAPDGREADFITIVTFGKTATNLAKYKSKGDLLQIAGRLTVDEWDDKDTGDKRSSIYIVADRIKYLGARRERTNSDDTDREPAYQG